MASSVKPFQTFEQQLEILIERGLVVDDNYRDLAISALKRVNYYRLSGAYSLTVCKDNHFYQGVSGLKKRIAYRGINK